ncbi:MAG: T9SS type A sorting domain-containing protein [Bacteroidales bacterium]
MKKYYLFFVFLLAGSYLSAQTNLYNTDFDTYTVGNKIALVAGAPWTTWSNAAGGAEDGTVSNTQSHSPSNAVKIVNNNDLVLQLNDKTAGRFKVSFWLYVEPNKIGYFNVLSDFAATNSLWALQVYIYNDSMYVDAGGSSAAKTTFQTGLWQQVNVIVDLDDDFATFYLDNTEIISYQWSKGAFGTNNSLKLDGVNFYGWDGTSSPTPTTWTQSGYYIDDVSYDSVPSPEAPLNLTAAINVNDVDVAWTAPSVTPDLYKVIRNNKVVYSTTGLTYTDVQPWPNTYTYSCRAHYIGEGYSHASNTASVTIPGGVEREFVLFEVGTGTWCQFCPGAALGIKDLIEVNDKDAVAIKYHQGDDYEIAVGTSRLAYYNITLFPTTVADGVLIHEGGNATTSIYSTYLPMYNERMGMPAFHTMNLNVVHMGGTNYQATITVDESFNAFADGVVLHTSLTESNIPVVWFNQTEIDYVCRAMYPDEYGTDLVFTGGNPATVTINFSTAGLIKNNCEFVAWVQNPSTKNVTQTGMVKMSTVVGTEELEAKQISVYPNPASTYVQVLTNGKGTANIYDVTGKLVSSTQIILPSQIIDIHELENGVYILKVDSPENSFSKKLIVE